MDAPWVVKGPINGKIFRVHVEKVPVPTLRPGDLVIMDNRGSHKGAAVRAAIRSVGARRVFLPKYSPGLNPIEQLFAKVKHHLRMAQELSAEAVGNAIGQILKALTQQQCENDLANAGYGET